MQRVMEGGKGEGGREGGREKKHTHNGYVQLYIVAKTCKSDKHPSKAITSLNHVLCLTALICVRNLVCN